MKRVERVSGSEWLCAVVEGKQFFAFDRGSPHLHGFREALEGELAAAIHLAVRKGDVKLGDSKIALLGVRVGHTNSTPLAVVRGVFKSIVVDALLRLDGAKLNFAGVSLRNHTSTSSQLSTHLGAHYFASLRQNLPALLGSLSAFGNPLGLVRGLGDGVRYVVRRSVWRVP